MTDLVREAARLFCIGFPGPEVGPEARELLGRGVAGVILFKRNIESAAQVAELCGELKRLAGRPLLTSLDQEGGRVRRLREGFSEIPPMRVLGKARDARLVRRVGEVLGRELRAVNIDLDYAPVLDVDTNPANPVIADRSFGADPELVAGLGCALIEGLQAAGVAACAKHFPGHGDTSQDSHVDLPRLRHAMDRLESVELPPFAAAIRAGVASIMTAHVVFERLDPEYPATMSRPALDGILRDRMGYGGVVISDDLEMKAVAEHFAIEDSVVRGVNAGVDLFLVCHHADVQVRAIEALASAVRSGEVSRQRFEEALRRVDALLSRWVRPAAPFEASVPGSAAHRALLAEIDAAPTGRDPTET